MDRKEKIYEELKSYSRSGEAEGLDAQQLAELTGIDRANVSRKLNELEREGRVIKLSGRPVRYMEREVYDKCQEKEKKAGRKLGKELPGALCRFRYGCMECIR